MLSPSASAPAAAASASTIPILIVVVVVVDLVPAFSVSPLAGPAATRRTVVLALAAWQVKEVDRLVVDCCRVAGALL